MSTHREPHHPSPDMVSLGIFRCGRCGDWLEPTPDGRALWHGSYPVHVDRPRGSRA
jgi:hypothetical protein